MNVTIHPKKLRGTLLVPPSKSLSHRAIIAASLAEGISKISNVLLSKDILATIEGMRALGAQIEVEGKELIIQGTSIRRVASSICANESGSTLRFLIPIALVCDEPITFTGKNQLIHRPLDTYFEIFDAYHISYEHPQGEYLPLSIMGGLKPGIYSLRGDISSQFITGLMFALPLLSGDSKILITTNLESKGYIDLTLDVLNQFGIVIDKISDKEYYVKGNQKYQARDYQVEGDYSQVAFYLVAGALGADIKLLGMNPHSYQGDQKIIQDLKDFKANINFNKDYLACYPSDTLATTIDFAQTPDLGPALTVLASLSKGTSHFIHAERLRIKECDRISCMKEELEKLGAKIIEQEDGMIIDGVSTLHGGIVDSHNDHRVAMALAMVSQKMTGDLTILNAKAVEKSYPNFWEDFEKLGGDVSYD